MNVYISWSLLEYLYEYVSLRILDLFCLCRVCMFYCIKATLWLRTYWTRPFHSIATYMHVHELFFRPGRAIYNTVKLLARNLEIAEVVHGNVLFTSATDIDKPVSVVLLIWGSAFVTQHARRLLIVRISRDCSLDLLSPLASNSMA